MSSKKQPDAFEEQKDSFNDLPQVRAADEEQEIAQQLWNKVKKRISKYLPNLSELPPELKSIRPPHHAMDLPDVSRYAHRPQQCRERGYRKYRERPWYQERLAFKSSAMDMGRGESVIISNMAQS
jgi:hypothetical protein